MADDRSVSFWWVALFVILALGVGVGAVLFVGGDLVAVAWPGPGVEFGVTG